MKYWPLKPVSVDYRLGVDQMADMLAQVGAVAPNALAGELLRLLSVHVPIAQCTVFAYGGQSTPRIVSFADRARTMQLPEISRTYASTYYRLDGNRDAMASGEVKGGASRIIVHRQSGDDIAHPDYRRICYDEPQISDRLALLNLFDGWRWLSVNFYRGREHGRFRPREIECIEALAPLIMQMVRLHYNVHLSANELPEMLVLRLCRTYPELTPRDADLLRCVLTGLSVEETAERMGVKLSSAQTYVKRLHRKLGVSAQRELVGLALKLAPH